MNSSNHIIHKVMLYNLFDGAVTEICLCYKNSMVLYQYFLDRIQFQSSFRCPSNSSEDKIFLQIFGIYASLKKLK